MPNVLEKRGLSSQGLTGVYYVADQPNVNADGRGDDLPAVQMAINICSTNGGGIVAFPPGVTLRVAGTISQPSNVALYLPAGCTVRLGAGLNLDLVRNSDQSGGNTGLAIFGQGTLDGNRANNTDGNRHVVDWRNVTYSRIEGVTIKSGSCYGICLSNCHDIELDNPTLTDNGSHGLRGEFIWWCPGSSVRSYDNCRTATSGTADGISLAVYSTDNSFLNSIAYDAASAGKRQGYGIREEVSSACDRNAFIGGSLNDNATGAILLDGGQSTAFILSNFTLPGGLTGSP